MFLYSQFDMTRWMPRASESPMHYWLSLSPMAPLFGVSWRFAELMPEFEAPAKAKKSRRVKADADEAVVVKPMEDALKAAEAMREATAEAVAEAVVVTKAVQGAAKEAVQGTMKTMSEVASTAAGTTTEAVEAVSEAADDLTKIKGVGPKMADALMANGVTSFAQIAAWSKAEVNRMDDLLGGLPGRIERDDWVGQAKDFIK